jgi:AraC family transcriptional regulator, dual regulator of chb operon
VGMHTFDQKPLFISFTALTKIYTILMHRLHIGAFLPRGDVCHVATTVLKAGETFTEHDHDFYEVFLIVDGAGYHRVNGRRIAVRSGDLVLIRPPDRHTFMLDQRGRMSLTNVAFPAAWFGHISRLWPDPREINRWIRAASPPTRATSAGGRAALEQLLLELAPATGPRHLLLARFCLEALRLLRQKTDDISPPPPWLEKCVQAMERPENLHCAISFFQRLSGRSPEHLARLCRRNFGTPPTGLLNRARIRHAQRLLLQSDAKVIDIAYACGFENLGYFHRVFRRLSGCTPRRWRLRHPPSAVPREKSTYLRGQG